MVAGTTFTSGTSQQGNSWDDGTNANRAAGVAGSAADDDYWQLTGVQLEVGDVATPFEYLGMGEQINLCERYYQIHGGPTGTHIWTGEITSGQYYYNMIDMRCQMSKAPTVTIQNEGLSGFNSITVANDSVYGIRAYVLANNTQARGYYQARYILDAEL